MSKKINVIVVLAGICALGLFLLNCGSSSSRPAGLLYVLTQGSNGIGNNVSSFSMNLDNGDLSLINSNTTTCQPPGGSCGAPLDILLDPTGATAFVLNQGVRCAEIFNSQTMMWECDPAGNPPVPPTIYPYTVNSDGSLSLPQTPVTWICANAGFSPCSDVPAVMTRDAAGQFLFVIDQGANPTPGYPTPTPTNPSCPHAPTSATDVCPSLSVFAMKPGSTTLTLASGSPIYLSKIPSALSSITFIPNSGTTPQELLFVTNNEDVCSQNCVPPSPHNDNTVSVYTVGSGGTLSEQPNSPYTIAAPNPISVIAVNTNQVGAATGGVFVYVGNQGSGPGALNPFQVCTVQNAVCTTGDVQNSLLLPLATCPQPSCDIAPTSAGQDPIQMVVDPTNNFLYVASAGSNQAFGFRIASTLGTLSPLPSSPQPTGSQPVSIALHPAVNNTGQFLYISNGDSDNISGFTLSTTTGIMSSPITVISPAIPSGLTAH
jgi:DNA-binding beta-propeller fold protein YncE